MFSTRQANVLRVLRLIGSPTRAYTTRKAALRCTQVLCQCNLNERTSPFLSRQDQRAGNFSVWCSTRQSRDATPLASEEEPWNCYYEEVLEHMKNRDAVLVDVRGVDEIRESGLLDGVHNIPLPELKDALELPADRFQEMYGLPKPEAEGEQVIFFCRSSIRSFKAVQLAQELGYTKVKHFPGGWQKWEEIEAEQQ